MAPPAATPSPSGIMMDPAYLLWEDQGIYRRRLEKSAAALVAIARALRESPPLPGAPEFLDLYLAAEGARPEHFTTVWRDPVAYHWVRRGVHLLASRRGAPLSAFERDYVAALGFERPADALAAHLREFAKFTLALALVAGEDVTLAAPYEAVLPLALPGSEVVLAGSGRVAIHGVSAGALDVTHDGRRLRLAPGARRPGGPQAERCPVVTVGNAHVVMNPYVFALPGLGLPRDLAAPVNAGGEPLPELLAETLRILKRFHPGAFSHFAEAIRIVALKQVREGDFGTLSHSELPGAFVCSVPSDRFALAADCIHELYHHRLFSLEEDGAFFEPDGEDAIDGELHYSPWRDRPRPLHGLLHAIYVYLPVFRFWSATYRADAHEGLRHEHVRDQLARIPFQLRIGVNQLRRSARLTPLGTALFEAIAREATAIETEAAGLGATLDAPAVSLRASGVFQAVTGGGRPRTVGETLLEHLARCDARGECAQERRALERAVGRAGG